MTQFPYELRRGGIVIKVQMDNSIGLGAGPKRILASAKHDNCPDVVLGWAATPPVLFCDPVKSRFALYIYHPDESLFDRGIETISAGQMTQRLDALKQVLEESALQLAKDNLAKLCGGCR